VTTSASRLATVAALAATILAGCGLPFTEAADREQIARENQRRAARRAQAVRQAGADSGCSDVELVISDSAFLRYVTLGCGLVSRIQLTCDGDICAARRESATRLSRPARLKEVGPGLWRDPTMGETCPDTGQSKTPLDPKLHKIETGQLIIDAQSERYRATLPEEFRTLGMVARNKFKIRVTTGGEVGAVDVLGSTRGLDAHWLSKIETWRYSPYRIDGKAVPFCYTLDLTVSVVGS
jgi:hypothetical protein